MKALLSVFIVSLSFLLVDSSIAQDVDFEVPSEINIIQGRLSVAFKDNITSEKASAMVESMGYSTLQSTFKFRIAKSTSPSAMEDATLKKLRAHPMVFSVNQSQLTEPIFSTRPDQEKPRFQITVQFLSHVSEKEAKNVLKKNSDLSFSFLPKPSNEIVIDVGHEDEEAYLALQERDEVKWVTYVGVAAGN